MLIAEEKRKNNIAEYILYMWQAEDLLRAVNFDPVRIEKYLVKGPGQSKTDSGIFRDWYLNLSAMMRNEGIEKTGHLQVLKNLVNDLNDFHSFLLKKPEETHYHMKFNDAIPLIMELKKKNQLKSNLVEICLEALYGLMLLRIQGKLVTPETERSLQTIVAMISDLSFKYLQFEKGENDAV